MNQKVLWKIEVLWKKYYYLSSRIVKQSHNRFRKIKSIYKSNVSRYNPHFYTVQKLSFEKSEKPVHSDEYGEYFGLKYSQVLEKDGKLIYLFDNHNKIIQSFLEYAELTGVDFDVVHIDAHDDDAFFASQKPHHLELKNVQKYIQQTRISDFFDFLSGLSLRGVEQSTTTKQPACRQAGLISVIPSKAGIQNQSKNIINSRIRGNDNDETCYCEPAKQSNVRLPEFSSGSKVSKPYEASNQTQDNKLINKIHRYTTSTDFHEFKRPERPYILSLDIDIFGPEGDFTDLESKIKIIAQAWRHADVVGIATSPGFIEQDYAHKIIEILTKRETDEFISVD